MKPRNWFPLDLAALLSFPFVLLAVTLVLVPVFPMLRWLHHPTPVPWLWALGVASLTALIGTGFLFLAKLPQYRAGNFLRLGCQHLSPKHQSLYRAAFWLIVPSIVVLLVLLAAAQRFR